MKKLLLIIAVFAVGCPSTSSQYSPYEKYNGVELTPLPPIPLGAPAYKVYVKGLVCPACAVGLKKFLLRLSFVKAIHINYKTGLALIYEKQLRDKGGKELDKSRITKAIEDSGYEVSKFE